MIEAGTPQRETTERSRGSRAHAIGRKRGRRWTALSARTRLEHVASPTVGRPILAAVLGVLLSLAMVPVFENWPRGSLGPTAPLAFLMPVVLASGVGGWWSGAGVTLAAVFIWNWFFLLPSQSIRIDSLDDVVTLLVYFCVATVVVQLSAATHRRTKGALQQEAELTAVLRVTNAVASTLDMAALLGLVLEQVHSVIECTSAAVLLQEGECICIAAYRGPATTQKVVGQSWPLAETSVYRKLVQRRAPLSVPDIWESSSDADLLRRAHKIRVLGQHHERSWLLIPLVAKEHVIGALSLSHIAPHSFTERHIHLAVAIASQVAVAIENA